MGGGGGGGGGVLWVLFYVKGVVVLGRWGSYGGGVRVSVMPLARGGFAFQIRCLFCADAPLLFLVCREIRGTGAETLWC